MLQFEHLCNLSVDVGDVVTMEHGPLGEPDLAWLNKSIAVATAERKARQVLLTACRLP